MIPKLFKGKKYKLFDSDDIYTIIALSIDHFKIIGAEKYTSLIGTTWYCRENDIIKSLEKINLEDFGVEI